MRKRAGTIAVDPNLGRNWLVRDLTQHMEEDDRSLVEAEIGGLRKYRLGLAPRFGLAAAGMLAAPVVGAGHAHLANGVRRLMNHPSVPVPTYRDAVAQDFGRYKRVGENIRKINAMTDLTPPAQPTSIGKLNSEESVRSMMNSLRESSEYAIRQEAAIADGMGAMGELSQTLRPIVLAGSILRPEVSFAVNRQKREALSAAKLLEKARYLQSRREGAGFWEAQMARKRGIRDAGRQLKAIKEGPVSIDR
jgi:hypothetical protein